MFLQMGTADPELTCNLPLTLVPPEGEEIPNIPISTSDPGWARLGATLAICCKEGCQLLQWGGVGAKEESNHEGQTGRYPRTSPLRVTVSLLSPVLTSPGTPLSFHPRSPSFPILEQGSVQGRLSQVGSSQKPLRPQVGGWLGPKPDVLLSTGPFSARGLLCCREPIPDLTPRAGAGSPSYCPLCVQPVGHEAGSDHKRSPSLPYLHENGLDCSQESSGLKSVKLQVWVSPLCSLCNYFFTQLTLINLPQASTHKERAGLSGLC